MESLLKPILLKTGLLAVNRSTKTITIMANLGQFGCSAWKRYFFMVS